jgi:hypothetical protein
MESTSWGLALDWWQESVNGEGGGDRRGGWLMNYRLQNTLSLNFLHSVYGHYTFYLLTVE